MTEEINSKIRSGSVAATQSGEQGALGNIFWYSVSSESELTREELTQLFQQIGIDENWLPNQDKTL